MKLIRSNNLNSTLTTNSQSTSFVQLGSPSLPSTAPRIRVPRHAGPMLLATVLVAWLALTVLHFDTFQIGTYLDDARYIGVAKALAAGRGFTQISYPNAPFETEYPPGYPILLAPVAILFPGSLAAFKIPSILFTLSSLPLWYIVLRRRLPYPLSFLTLAAVATNTYIVDDATLVMSEAAFLVLTSVFFVLAEGYADPTPYPLAKSASVALVLIALYFVRSIGVVFLGVTVVYLLYTRRVRHAVLVTGLFSIPWGIWTIYRRSSGQGLIASTYQTMLVHTSPNSAELIGPVGLIRRVIVNVNAYATVSVPHLLSFDTSGPWELRTTKTLLAATHLTWLGDAIPPVTTVVIVLGLARALRVRFGFPEFAVFGYCVSLLLVRWISVRYLHPTVPIIYVSLILGVDLVIRRLLPARISKARSQQILALFVGGIVLFNLGLDIHSIRDPVRNRITDISVGTSWIARNSPASSIVMGEFAVPQSLYTERKSVDFPALDAVHSGWYLDEIRRQSVSYVMIAPPIQSPRTIKLGDVAAALQQELRNHPEEFRLVFRSTADNVEVYQVGG